MFTTQFSSSARFENINKPCLFTGFIYILLLLCLECAFVFLTTSPLLAKSFHCLLRM